MTINKTTLEELVSTAVKHESDYCRQNHRGNFVDSCWSCQFDKRFLEAFTNEALKKENEHDNQ